MHVTVGYLATATGEDGVALAAAIAKTFDATVDVVLVVREELPDGHPGRAQYQQFLVDRGEEWIAKAVKKIHRAGVDDVNSTVLVGDTASSLLAFAEEKNTDLIVIGGARDGLFSRHGVGPVATSLLYSSSKPVALAPAGYAYDPPEVLTGVTAAVPNQPGDDNPLPFAFTLASAAGMRLRMISLVSGDTLYDDAEHYRELRQIQIEAAQENMALAARALPDAPEIESIVASGSTLESALRKLRWDDADVLVVGSSRLGSPRRLFLGSTAARILSGIDGPVIVVPREE
jgi:nucleotide-binding universal stress UspA family protein